MDDRNDGEHGAAEPFAAPPERGANVRRQGGRGTLHRRQVLAAGGACLASCATRATFARKGGSRLDELLDAHAAVLPERPGAGANHYPMAAEALEALGYGAEIDASWIDGAALYTGEPGRLRPIDGVADLDAALGDHARFGDWLDHFRARVQHGSWRSTVATWAPRLAPAMCAAAFHGVIRTGHACRALRERDTGERRHELAVGLAYWAARYVELPTRPEAPMGSAADEPSLEATLAGLSSPWLDDRSDVSFFDVVGRLTERPLAPPVTLAEQGPTPSADLDGIVRAAATGFLEMLVLERNRIWLLHTVTGPAALQWLLPEVDATGARTLVAYARQAVVAMYAAYGEPFTARAHVRGATRPWPALVQQAVDSRSVHGIKLIDALQRFDREDDALLRSVAEQWFEWT